MTFADKLRELRVAAGLTQGSLAKASGISLGAIRDYEQGNKEPKLSSAQKLARALGTDCTAFEGTIRAEQEEEKPIGRPRKKPAPEKPAKRRGKKQ